jgi:outer membrane receptor protein involved in Fe transport
MKRLVALTVAVWTVAALAVAQNPSSGQLQGRVTDETGGALPGVVVELRLLSGGPPRELPSSATGDYAFDHLAPGRYQLSFSLINFGSIVHRDIDVASSPVVVNAVMHLALNAEVTVTGKRTFTNLADVGNPAENLVGIAQSASQGAITAQQLDVRPLMRTGEVLETVPGLIVTQHSGEGKANQYFLRGFNLDHGTDLAQTIAGVPVNMPTHAHGQGYSDTSFMIPELVTGVQFSKGPYFADQGDFATAGSTNINYATTLDRAIAHVDFGSQAYSRAVFAASPQVGSGHLLGAVEVAHDDGPWVHPDDYRKLNGVLRYSRGDSVNALAITAMGYHGEWNSTDQLAARAISEGLVSRFGAIDPSDGGHSYRYSGSVDWQHGTGTSLTKVTAYGIGYDLHLFSNFTYYLEDPERGDQIEQADRRFVTGGKAMHRRVTRWGGHAVQNTFGVQIRNDDITNVGLYHSEARQRLNTRNQAAVLETQAGVYAQNEIEWAPWLRTQAGLRADGARFRVDAVDLVNSGRSSDGLFSPKAGVTIGPFEGTEIYVNAGTGFHSNDARGTTLTRDPGGNSVEPVTPLVRAKGAEVGVRTVAVPHLQSTATVWMLRLDSELVFVGDEGGSEASRPSRRYGVEWTNYYSPRPWLVLDFDASWSRARFADSDPVGDYIPEAVGTVLSAGASVAGYHRIYGSLRWRYFGPRALIEDNSERSNATSLFNLEAGYQLAKNVRVNLSVFNLFNAAEADIDYFYVSRLPGEPSGGIADFHTHPTIPRTARVNLVVGF